jgi:hypothetical protein
MHVESQSKSSDNKLQRGNFSPNAWLKTNKTIMACMYPILSDIGVCVYAQFQVEFSGRVAVVKTSLQVNWAGGEAVTLGILAFIKPRRMRTRSGSAFAGSRTSASQAVTKATRSRSISRCHAAGSAAICEAVGSAASCGATGSAASFEAAGASAICNFD